MHVSYSELIRIAPESIRMLGFGFGQADDSVECFVWTQCVLGRGYELLRMADGLRPAGGWPGHVHTDVAGAAVVNLRGQPALAYAARLTDLARCQAAQSDRNGVGLVVARGAFGGWIAPFMGFALARSGYGGAVLWWAGAAAVPGDLPATLVAIDRSSEGEDELLVAPASAHGVEAAGNVPEAGRVPQAVAARLGELVAGTAAESVLAVVATRGSWSGPGASLASALEMAPRLRRQLADVGHLPWGRRLRRAVDIGMEVEADEHGILTRLAQRIRLPNSERSRNQAG